MLGFGLYILAWIVLWNFSIRIIASHHANSPAAQGISNLI